MSHCNVKFVEDLLLPFLSDVLVMGGGVKLATSKL